MILVAGGTGRLGTQTVTRLVARGAAVRVLTREPGRAAHLAELPAAVVVGDVRRPATLPAALAGVTVVVSAVHGFAGPGRVSPRTVDRDGNAHLVDAAAAAGAHVVLVSVWGAAADAPMSLQRAKHHAEQHLRASGVPWTIVRAAAFTETWADLLASGVVPGRGENPVAFVSVTDVAALVCDAVLDPALRSRVLEAVGPDDATLTALAHAVQRRTGRPRPVRHVPSVVLRAAAPFSRRAQAAVVMDTAPMTADRSARPAGGTAVAAVLDRLRPGPA